jgi:heterodisulfide reductase subunit A-like polyferredoxin
MDVGRHPNIHLLAYSEVEKVEGEAGNFQVTVCKKPRYVDENKCTGCGTCAEKCPTVTSDVYNLGLGTAKSIYKYFAQGIPSAYTIDATQCRNFQAGKKCGVCQKVCQAGAIDYKQEEKFLDFPVGAIIVATGYDLFDARKIPEYGYNRLPNVVTALEFERFLSASGPTHGHVYRPTDLALQASLPEVKKAHQKAEKALERFEKHFQMTSAAFAFRYESGELQRKDEDYDKWAEAVLTYRQGQHELETLQQRVDRIEAAHRLAFIQCVGSRDLRFNKYCSGFCCMHAIKEAIIAKEHDRACQVYMLAMDIRAVGKGFEEYRNRGAMESGIHYIRSRVAEITEDRDHTPIIWYEDTKERGVHHLPVDLVILSTACEPSAAVERLAKLLAIELNEFGFFKTASYPPLDTTRPGVFVCGCARSPMDIPDSVAQASSAAARAAQVLSGSPPLRLAS